MKDLVRLFLSFLIQMTAQLVQNNLRIPQMIAAVHFIHTGVHVLRALQLFLILSELHPTAEGVSLLLPSTSSFHFPQHEAGPAQHLFAASPSDLIIALSLVG